MPWTKLMPLLRGLYSKSLSSAQAKLQHARYARQLLALARMGESRLPELCNCPYELGRRRREMSGLFQAINETVEDIRIGVACPSVFRTIDSLLHVLGRDDEVAESLLQLRSSLHCELTVGAMRVRPLTIVDYVRVTVRRSLPLWFRRMTRLRSRRAG